MAGTVDEGTPSALSQMTPTRQFRDEVAYPSEQRELQQQPSHPLRRQSDSTLTWREHLPGHGKHDDARAKLRQWAAEALDAPPPLLAPCEPTPPDHMSPKSVSLGRRNRTRSKSPSASSRLDADVIFARPKSLFVPAETLTASPVQTAEGVIQATSSPPVLPSKATNYDAISSMLPVSLAMAPTSSSPNNTHKGLAQRRLESGQLNAELRLSVSGLAHLGTPPDADHLRSGSIGGVGGGGDNIEISNTRHLDETTPRPRSTLSQRGLLPHLLTASWSSSSSNSAQPRKTVRLEEPVTPRASGGGGASDSPRSTVSTCESEEDRSIMTPLDDGILVSGHRVVSSSSSGYVPFGLTGISGTASSGLSDASAKMIGLDLGDSHINDGSSDSPITTHINDSGRSGFSSIEHIEKGAGDHCRSPASKGTSSSIAASPYPEPVPPLSRSNPKDLGSIEGLTPPLLPIITHQGPPRDSSAESSSVVSAGLEMGLGMNRTSAVLADQLPIRTTGFSNFSELRHHRRASLASDVRELTGLARPGGANDGPKVTEAEFTEAELTYRDRVDNMNRPTLVSSYDHAVDEMLMSNLSLTDTDLARRKTTGWDAKKAWGVVSKRGRADTSDEAISHLALRNSSVLHRKNQDVPPVISVLPLPVDASDPPRGGASSTRSSLDSRDTQARASRTGSTQVDTPSLSGRAMLSPDVNPLVDVRGGYLADDGINEDEHVKQARAALLRDAMSGGQARSGNNGGLMGSNVGGHFGPGVRAKIIDVLEPLIADVPLRGEKDEVIHLAEYGCLNSRSIPLMQLIISKFSRRSASATGRSHDGSGANGPNYRELITVSEESMLDSRSYSAFDGGHESLGGGCLLPQLHEQSQSSKMSFTVLHEDAPTSDFRPIIQSLDSRSDSYLDAQWQASHRPSLQNCVFSSFVGRPFASRVAPPQTMHFGLSLMDLHWTHTPHNNAVPLSTCSHAELSTFLKARACEFKQGGVLMMAFLARSEENSQTKRRKSAPQVSGSPTTPLQHERAGSLRGLPVASGTPDGGASFTRKSSTDIWTKLTNTLAPCIQRLVSCGMLKSDVARHLLDLPLHPRTPRQTQSALGSLGHLWKTEWSCGLGQEGYSDAHDATTASDSGLLRLPPSEPQPLRISHPAWKAFQAGTLSRVAFTEHMLMLFKNLYETHFRTVLRERGKLSKGAVEFVLDSLWDILSSKIDDQHPNNPFEEVEIEVTVCALRRA